MNQPVAKKSLSNNTVSMTPSPSSINTSSSTNSNTKSKPPTKPKPKVPTSSTNNKPLEKKLNSANTKKTNGNQGKKNNQGSNNQGSNNQGSNNQGSNNKGNNNKGNNNKGNNNQGNNNQSKSNNKVSRSIAAKVLLYLLLFIIIVNILVLVYINIVHRKNYTASDAVVISGNCEDKENILGIRKSKCKFKIKYSILDTDNKQISFENEIIIKDKNNIREINGNKIIKIDVHSNNYQKVKIQRDLARDNFNLALSLVILISLSFLTYKISLKK